MDWAKELIPDADSWIHDLINSEIDARDDKIKELEAERDEWKLRAESLEATKQFEDK